MRPSRRVFLQRAGVLAALAAPALAAAPARVAVVGGGFGGATAARQLKAAAPEVEVTLIEANARYTACPFSNLVLAGERRLASQQFGYAAVAAAGVRTVHDRVLAVDGAARRLRLAGGAVLGYDRLILAPGIRLRWNAVEGYDETAAQHMPHAWQAGAQTLLLRRRLEAMDDGGLVIIAAPANPYRCPPGPYERASLVAGWLAKARPRSKLLILDAKDRFSKQALFEAAWRDRFGDRVSWQGLSDGGSLRRVDAAAGVVETDFDRYRPAVANVIPPQRAGVVADRAGVSDVSGWCPVDPVSFESTLVPGIHVIGDAAIANAMPKSAFAANAQGKVCALQVARLLRGQAPLSTTLLNTCYSLIASDYAISVAGVYRPGTGALEEVAGAGGTSPLDAPPALRAAEARYARDWFAAITREVFG